MSYPSERTSETELPAKLSCRTGLSRAQLRTGLVGSGLLIAAVGIVPGVTGRVIGVTLFGLLMGMLVMRLALALGGVYLRRQRQRSVRPAPQETLPVYSVLVPLYQEAPIVDQLAWSLGRLNWPADRLDIQLLLEPDDHATRSAVADASFPEGTRLTLVPRGGPRTKPNALNVGLRSARGEYICIFDAEDVPAPDQLIESFGRFVSGPKSLAALQAPLVGTAKSGNWIAAQWQLEYAIDFELVKPAMAALGIPLPLGGSSNHFRTQSLRDVGGWDAWNMTEDADLGLRLARLGYEVSMITPLTREMAPDCFAIWLPQRTRWIKGFLMSWAVLMRHPLTLFRQLGPGRFLATQLTFGASVLTPFLYGPAALVIIVTLVHDRLRLGAAGWTLLVSGVGVATLSACLAPRRDGLTRILAIFTQSLYWPLLTIAAFRAIWDLYRRPWYWAKTPHRPDGAGDCACSTGSSASARRSH